MSDHRPFAVDGTVTREKLQELLAVQTEYDALDFKAFLDPTGKAERVEFAKDVAAMQSLPSGGYIIVGISDDGKPTDHAGRIEAGHFDETVLRNAVTPYLDQPINLAAKVHTVDGIEVALIFIARRIDGFSIMRADGIKNDRPVFRKGDVYVRHGTSSERWQQHDVALLLAERDRRLREQIRAEVIQELEQGQKAINFAEAPLGYLSWKLSDEDFTSGFREVVRGQDHAALRAAILPMQGDAERFIKDDDKEQFLTVVDRATAAAATALTFGSFARFAECLDVLKAIYGQPDIRWLNERSQGFRWWSIATRAEALGGLAVRLKEWEAVREIASHPVTTESGYVYSSWLRHAFVTASRDDLIPNDGGEIRLGAALIAFAREHAATITALHPDYSEVPSQPQGNGRDGLLDSIAQFDLLWCILAVARGRESDQFPGFSLYASRRAGPAFDLIAENPEVRQALLPGSDNEAWRESIRLVSDRAALQSMHYGETWTINSNSAEQFIKGTE